MANKQHKMLVVAVSTCAGNEKRRQACRKSWFQYKNSESSPLSQQQKDVVEVAFLAAEGAEELSKEQELYKDFVLLNAPEGYENLWRKALTYLTWLEQQPWDYDYFMHADDDSFVRLDLLLPYLENCPKQLFYWGYIWNDGSRRYTDVIRNPRNKSYMPHEQYPSDVYPPFASGCGFVLSRDLVRALLKQPLPDYRILDPPFGIHLCGQERCVLDEPIVPVHEDRVRPYRPLPMFRADSFVQHYMRPEEMQPFYQQALQHARDMKEHPERAAAVDPGPAEELYAQLVQMGLLKR